MAITSLVLLFIAQSNEKELRGQTHQSKYFFGEMTGKFALKQSSFLLWNNIQFCIFMIIQFLNFFYHPHTQTLTNPHHHTYKISPGTNQIRPILIHIIKHPHRGTQLDEQTLENFTVLLI